MAEHGDDYQLLLDLKRFLGEVEQGIRFANREIIHELIPNLSTETVLSFAVAVARSRARYLEAAFKLGSDGHGDVPGAGHIAELRDRREAYEEARTAFDALRDAIEKGYVDIDKKEKGDA